MAYEQPGTANPTPNPLVGIKPTPNGNPMGVSADGVKKENYVQPGTENPILNEHVLGVVPMFNGRIL